MNKTDQTEYIPLNTEDSEDLKKSYVLTFIQTQENKSSPKETIENEYTEKIILYGYVVVILIFCLKFFFVKYLIQ